MEHPLRARNAAILALSVVASLALIVQFPTKLVRAAPPQQSSSSSNGFLGAWCAQGDPSKHCAITGNGVFLTLTNENGNTSPGTFQGMEQNVITAPGWQFVKGTLSPDGSQINWSNGTYWTRCSGRGGGGHRPNLDGTWYRSGKRSMSCSIRQSHGNLTLRNEQGQQGTGYFDSNRHITTNWSGTTIGGDISQDGNTIYWNNGTSWTR